MAAFSGFEELGKNSRAGGSALRYSQWIGNLKQNLLRILNEVSSFGKVDQLPKVEQSTALTYFERHAFVVVIASVTLPLELSKIA